MNGKEKAIVFVHHIVREDAQLFFGFSDKSEREIFRHLISVSGVGANTGRTILSSLAPGELTEAILSGNTAVLNKIKGIGAKTAQRIIVVITSYSIHYTKLYEYELLLICFC